MGRGFRRRREPRGLLGKRADLGEVDALPKKFLNLELAERRRLADLGIECVVFQPGGNRPLAGDWLELLRQGIAELEAVAAI